MTNLLDAVKGQSARDKLIPRCVLWPNEIISALAHEATVVLGNFTDTLLVNNRSLLQNCCLVADSRSFPLFTLVRYLPIFVAKGYINIDHMCLCRSKYSNQQHKCFNWAKAIHVNINHVKNELLLNLLKL